MAVLGVVLYIQSEWLTNPCRWHPDADYLPAHHLSLHRLFRRPGRRDLASTGALHFMPYQQSSTMDVKGRGFRPTLDWAP